MRIMIGIGHPKSVHLFKNTIDNLINDGHEVKIAAWDKDITLYLLNVYGFEHELIGKNYKGLFRKALGVFENDLKVFRVAEKFKPDIFVSGAPYLAHVSKAVGKPCIQFWDTEHANLAHWLAYPFSNLICTPSCFKKKFNQKKHITFNGYMELAYLHPNHFKPDPSVLDKLELSKDEKFITLRFVSWEASHDVGQCGLINKEELVRKIEDYGRPIITSERKLNKKFEKYKITVPPEKIHDLLYYSTMYIGEGATMASESAVLGTPSIYVNTQRLGYLDEEEDRYGLVYNFSDPKKTYERVIKKAIELLEDKNLKKKWQKKREKLLSEKIDVTRFMTEIIENYPEILQTKNEIVDLIR